MFKLENCCNHNFISNCFYVYEYWINERCIYVGKGCDDRYKRHLYYRNNPNIIKTNPHFYRTIAKNVIEGNTFNIKIVYSGNEVDCFRHEITLIEHYGNTLNICKGGYGASTPGIKVHQYSMCGEFIKEYKNAKEAARLNGWKNYSIICGCCRGKEASYKNFLWCYANSKPRYPKKNKPVKQLNDLKETVRTFPNASKAAQHHKCDNSNIRSAIKRQGKSCGYYWDYLYF